MKRKFVAIILGLTLTGSSLSTFAAEASDDTAAASENISIDEEEQQETVTGQIVEITDDTVILSPGTLESYDAQESVSSDTNAESDNADAAEKETPTLTLSGEETTYQFADNILASENTEQIPVTVIEAAEAETDTAESSDTGEKETSVSENISDDADTSAQETEDTVIISIEYIQAGDIVLARLNEDGEISEITLLYSTHTGDILNSSTSETEE